MVNYLVLGGGVAGMTCAEELSRLVGHDDQILLISQSRILKIVTNVQAISKTTETFDLVSTDIEHYQKSGFLVLQETIDYIDKTNRWLVTSNGTRHSYDKLCIATGGRPNVLFDHPHVMGIRDMESVNELCQRLSHARRIMVVGNGGIALELLNEIRRIPMIWTIKDNYLGNTFLDSGASSFFVPHLFTKNEPCISQLLSGTIAKNRTKLARNSYPRIFNQDDTSNVPGACKRTQSRCASPGASLGPAWRNSLVLPHAKAINPLEHSDRDIIIESECHVVEVYTREEYIYAKRKNREFHSGSDSYNTQAETASWIEVDPFPNKKIPKNHDARTATEPVAFVPHLCGEGRLGLIPRDELEKIQEKVGKSMPSKSFMETSPCETRPFSFAHVHSNAQTKSRDYPGPYSTMDDGSTHRDPTDQSWPLYVRLSNNKVYGVDLMISATGVLPNVSIAQAAGLDVAPCEVSSDNSILYGKATGGIIVDKNMQTSDPHIYAAGDCVTCAWADRSPHWFQMRLWSQARIMGLQAARSMVCDSPTRFRHNYRANLSSNNIPPTPLSPPQVLETSYLQSEHFPLFPPPSEYTPIPTSTHQLPSTSPPPPLDVHFELFAHVSHFFGFKVVLIGLFNAQGLVPGSFDVLVRSKHPGEYVKIVKDRQTHRLRGAMLIGETGLEELVENLILTGVDVSFFEDAVLNRDLNFDITLLEAEGLDECVLESASKNDQVSALESPVDAFALNAFIGLSNPL